MRAGQEGLVRERERGGGWAVWGRGRGVEGREEGGMESVGEEDG